MLVSEDLSKIGGLLWLKRAFVDSTLDNSPPVTVVLCFELAMNTRVGVEVAFTDVVKFLRTWGVVCGRTLVRFLKTVAFPRKAVDEFFGQTILFTMWQCSSSGVLL